MVDLFAHPSPCTPPKNKVDKRKQAAVAILKLVVHCQRETNGNGIKMINKVDQRTIRTLTRMK